MSSASPGVDSAFKKLQRFLFMGAENNRYVCRFCLNRVSRHFAVYPDENSDSDEIL